MEASNPCNCIKCNVFIRSIFRDEKFDELVNIKGNCIHFRKHDYLFHENQPSAGVYCIRSGKLLITKKNLTGAESPLAIADPGEIIGLSAILYYHDKYSTSAMALNDGSACFIAKEEFMQEVKEHPRISINASTLLTQKLNKLEHNI